MCKIVLFCLVSAKCNLSVLQITVETLDGFEISDEQEFHLYTANEANPSFLIRKNSSETSNQVTRETPEIVIEVDGHTPILLAARGSDDVEAPSITSVYICFSLFTMFEI